MFKVTYTKHFTEGNLKGLHYEASLNFPSEATAKDWIDAMKPSKTSATSVKEETQLRERLLTIADSKATSFPFTTSNFRLANIS